MVARSLLYFHADKSCVSFRRIVVMSAELESMYLAFQNNQVPGVWTRVAYPCLKPLASWMNDFHRRIEFFNKLVAFLAQLAVVPGIIIHGYLTSADSLLGVFGKSIATRNRASL